MTNHCSHYFTVQVQILCNFSCMMTGGMAVYANDEFNMMIKAIKQSMKSSGANWELTNIMITGCGGTN